VLVLKLRSNGEFSRLKGRFAPRGFEDPRFMGENLGIFGRIGMRRKDSHTIDDISIQLGLSTMLGMPAATGQPCTKIAAYDVPNAFLRSDYLEPENRPYCDWPLQLAQYPEELHEVLGYIPGTCLCLNVACYGTSD
jgi:hypothetical protein